MKKLVSVMLCLLMIAAMAVTAFADGSAAFTLTGPSGQLSRGDSITLNASVSSSASATTYGLKLSFNTDVFELVGGACTVPGTLVSSFNNGFAFMFQSATAYSGEVGTVTLRVKDDAPGGNYTIEGVASVKNGSEAVTATGGSVSFNVYVPCDHNFGAWVENGDVHEQTCTLCGTVNSAAHSWDAGVETLAPSCTAEGELTYTCTVCGATEVEPIDVVDHNYGAASSVDGEEHVYTCADCGGEEYEAHAWYEVEVVTAATCTSEGLAIVGCECCDYQEEQVVPVTDHNYGPWTTTVAPTTETTGERERECQDCGHVQTEVVPAVSSPATGDTQLVLWTTLMVIAACGAAAVVFFSSKKKLF